MVTAEEKDGFQAIFDGKTLEGWSGNDKFWSVKDGTITDLDGNSYEQHANVTVE